jgi:NAD(P)H-hydrate epimerase
MKALTASEMREVDRLTTERCGIAGAQLMENAGTSVCEVLLDRFGDSGRREAAILCGKGNNGGDGFVVARLLHERGWKPRVYLLANPETVRGEAAINLARLGECGVEVLVITDMRHWETVRGELAADAVIIDALLGTGISGAAEGLLAAVIEHVNKISRDCRAATPEMVLAVDTPSGLPADGGPAQGPLICAHTTVTFTAPKIGQLISKDAGYCGKLVVREIGSPRELIDEVGKSPVSWLEPEEFRELPLLRRADAHKGSYGHVLLVAGSRGKSGAAILAGRGALRAGAGLVTVALPESVLPIVAAAQAELMTEPLLSTETGTASLANLEYGRFAAIVKGKTVLAIGPGFGTHQETQQFVRTIVRENTQPIILDADGLNAFANRASELKQRKSGFLAITPHPGEMGRLLGKSNEEVQTDRANIASRAAAEWNAHVILKGYHSVLATPNGRVFVNTTGNPGMAKGGTGDLLTGILAGLTAQFGPEDWEKALGFGVYLHGLAGDEAALARGDASLLASEIAEFLPDAYRRIVWELRPHES